MRRRFDRPVIALLTVNLAGLCMLGFHRPSSAAPGAGNEPFANAVEQRAEMIAELREIGVLLKEQNALLRSGEVKVVIKNPAGR